MIEKKQENSIDEIEIKDFKKIKEVSIKISQINIFIGCNNSGKSCILQGIHFGVMLSRSKKLAKSQQFSPELLQYCPTADFLTLQNGSQLTESSQVKFTYKMNLKGKDDVAEIILSRGRNGVVKVQDNGEKRRKKNKNDNKKFSEQENLLEKISSDKSFFSIYVPGLAGIVIKEEYHSDAVINMGIARGDANLYLRNVLLRIEEHEDKKNKFDEYIKKIFPSIKEIKTVFSYEEDLWIKSYINEGGNNRAIDMAGTGCLQAIQILAYVTNYNPTILLLDEPDAHLHPSHQRTLANVLDEITENSNTKIILATHSRHLLDSLNGNKKANLFYVNEEGVEIQKDWETNAILMDLGALDKREYFDGKYKYIIWTEDSNTELLEILLKSNGILMKEVYIFSYKTSSKIDAAILLAELMELISPAATLIIHRDRDFMNEDDISLIKEKYNFKGNKQKKLFITEYSDIEGYFTDKSHIAETCEMKQDKVENMFKEIIKENNAKLITYYNDKIKEIKYNLYKNKREQHFKDRYVRTNEGIICEECVIGKILLSMINDYLNKKGKDPNCIKKETQFLKKDNIRHLFENSPKRN